MGKRGLPPRPRPPLLHYLPQPLCASRTACGRLARSASFLRAHAASHPHPTAPSAPHPPLWRLPPPAPLSPQLPRTTAHPQACAAVALGAGAAAPALPQMQQWTCRAWGGPQQALCRTASDGAAVVPRSSTGSCAAISASVGSAPRCIWGAGWDACCSRALFDLGWGVL